MIADTSVMHFTYSISLILCKKKSEESFYYYPCFVDEKVEDHRKLENFAKSCTTKISELRLETRQIQIQVSTLDHYATSFLSKRLWTG